MTSFPTRLGTTGSSRAPVAEAAGGARIVRQTLHEEVVARLRDMIVEGELTPGSRVPERELCSLFGISRTPLREAVKVLASEGLVELMPNRGATVAILTLNEVDDTFPIMGALECLSGKLACQRITDVELDEIRALHYQMLANYRKGDRREYFRLNQAIHESILMAARNPTLSNIYRGLAGRIRPARYMANMSAERWKQAVEEHERLLKALESRDGDALGQILTDHLEHKRETVRESWMAEMASEQAETDETAA